MEAIGDIENRESVLSSVEKMIQGKREKLLARTANNPDWVKNTTSQLEEARKTGIVGTGISNIKNLLGVGNNKENNNARTYDAIPLESARQFTVGQQISNLLHIDDIKESWRKGKEDWNKVKDFFNIGKEKKK